MASNVKQLEESLNQFDFKAFPQKNNTKRVTVSIACEDGNRYFLTRAVVGTNPDATPKYAWVRGTAMRPQEPQGSADQAPLPNA